jgi:hypothetical protein
LVVSSRQNLNPKPYTDAMSVSLWTQPTNEFRFQTLFPNLEKRKFGQIIVWVFQQNIWGFFLSIRSANFGKIVGKFANFNITKLKKQSLI